MKRDQIIHLLDSGRTTFAIRKTKVYVNGEFRDKYKFLETIEIITKKEEEAKFLAKEFSCNYGEKYFKEQRWFRLRVTGTKAYAVCLKYINFLDKNKERAHLLMKLSEHKALRSRNKFQNKQYREELKQKTRLC